MVFQKKTSGAPSKTQFSHQKSKKQDSSDNIFLPCIVIGTAPSEVTTTSP